MRSAGIYLVEAEIGTVRFCPLPEGEITITFRVGRSFASTIFNNPAPTKGETSLNSLIQLNVDSTALQAQRCSLTFSTTDKHTLGIALISLPKDKNLVQSTYRLTQSEDKRAEVQVKIKISIFQSSSSSLNRMASLQYKSQNSLHASSVKESDPKGSTDSNQLLKIYVNNNMQKGDSSVSNMQSNINVKSKISQEFSQASGEEKRLRNFKLREEDRIIQTTESQIKRYKDEKEVYYQLYQIEKSKNQIAAKFISNLIKRIVEKAPALASILNEENTEPKDLFVGQKKNHKNHQQQLQQDSAMIAQLEQANRSLHRQLQEYKRLVEQMKLDIIKPKDTTIDPKHSANLILPGLLELSGSKSAVRERSTLRPTPSSLKDIKHDKPNTNQFKQVDLNKWLTMSIGQREGIQDMLKNMTQAPAVAETTEKKENGLKKIKTKLDKSFATLLTMREVTKEALLNHKKEVNKFFDEILNS